MEFRKELSCGPSSTLLPKGQCVCLSVKPCRLHACVENVESAVVGIVELRVFLHNVPSIREEFFREPNLSPMRALRIVLNVIVRVAEGHVQA